MHRILEPLNMQFLGLQAADYFLSSMTDPSPTLPPPTRASPSRNIPNSLYTSTRAKKCIISRVWGQGAREDSTRDSTSYFQSKLFVLVVWLCLCLWSIRQG